MMPYDKPKVTIHATGIFLTSNFLIFLGGIERDQ